MVVSYLLVRKKIKSLDKYVPNLKEFIDRKVSERKKKRNLRDTGVQRRDY